MATDPASRGKSRALRIGKYEVIAHIAAGGMGAVYKARDVELGREVALKILPPEMAVKPNMLERFRREARSAARLRHENIVTLYEFGEASGTYFLALEFVEGIDLHAYISRKVRLKPDEAKSILLQAVRALDHAHRQGIVHRDIKPSNFLVIPQGDDPLVKLTDFGLAQARDDEEARAAEFRLTRAGTTVGTVDYMAPEQARDSSAADIRSDIYSLGCTFYHMLGGNCPFPEGSLTERIFKHIEAEPPDVRRLNPDVPAGLVATLRRMLEKRPEDRFQSPQELLVALGDPERLDGLRVEKPPVPWEEAVKAEAAPTELLLKPRPKKPKTDQAAQKVQPRLLGKGRLRDEDDDEPARVRKQARPWWPWAASAAGLLVAAGLIAFVLANQDRPVPPDHNGRAAVTKKKPSEDLDTAKKKPQIKIDPTTKRANPPTFPLLYDPVVPLDLARVRQEFEGPPRKPTPPAVDTVTFRVRRLPPTEPDWFSTLAQACAKAPEGRATVIEIHDNGPLFEQSLTPMQNRHVTVRAGKGYRPLVAWDAAASKSHQFLTLDKGSLTLENLDVVLKWTDERATEPASLFHVIGDFTAEQCTFSITGKHPHGIIVVRLEASENTRCRIGRSYFRGHNVTALLVQGNGADVLIDGCLLVGGEAPLLAVVTDEEYAATVRIVRSTLVCAKTLARISSSTNAECRPAVHWYLWDSLLARCGPLVDSELLRLGTGILTDGMRWRAVNSLYAGWEKLLVDGTKTLTALDDWRKLWRLHEGDQAQRHPWPEKRPSDLEDADAELYQVLDSPVCFQATSTPGPLGCDVNGLSPGRAGWLSFTFERFVIPAIEWSGTEAKPAIPAAENGAYAGERLELTKKIDLGKHLQSRLEKAKPAPKIVFQLHGEGEQMTSPIRIKGSDLVVYVEPPAAKSKPLTLVPNPNTGADREALIEVEDGSLELIGARMVFPNQVRAPVPKRMVMVRGGDLRIQDSHLEGPLGNAPAAYQALLHFEGSGQDGAEKARNCAIHQSVLLSGRTIVSVRGTGARLRLQQSVFVAVADVLRFELGPNPRTRLNVQCSLDHNTFAFRGAALVIPEVPSLSKLAEPLVVQADANLFLDPFVEEPRQASLVRSSGEMFSRGVLIWQGRANAFDEKRLQAYVAPPEEGMVEKQSHRNWAQLWGPLGEQMPLFVSWPAFPPSTFSQDKVLLERLRLPPQVRATVGADLYRLKIPSIKK